MADVHVYDVELLVLRAGETKPSLVTRREHAYSIMDAAMQAGINYSGQSDVPVTSTKIVRIGPPLDVALESQGLKDDLVAAVIERMPDALAATGHTFRNLK